MSARTAESERLELQSALDAERSALERNQLGQFATPPELAEAVVKLAVSYRDKSKPIRFLDPAIGSGAFFSALLRCVPADKIASARGVEFDVRFVEAARTLWGSSGLQVDHADFTTLPPPDVQDRANVLIANPPYVRHHHIPGWQKSQLTEAVRRAGITVSGLAGLYVYFLILSYDWMEEDGVAVWLIPSEWLSVNYGRALKKFFRERVRLLRIHVFEAADVQFGDALVSSAVVVFRKERPVPAGVVHLTYGGNIEHPERSAQVAMGSLSPTAKWTRSAILRASVPGEHQASHATIGDLFQIRRGLATGLNNFFIATYDHFRSLGLDDQFLRPVLPPSRHMPNAVVERSVNGYPLLEDPLALLDCALAEEEVERAYPALWQYLQSDMGQRAKQSYLSRSRRPWYSQERRAPAPYVCTYMGRGKAGASPFRFYLNRSDAVATNVYLMLYPKRALAEMLRANPLFDVKLLQLLTEAAAAGFHEHGRVYGGGLHKLEPRELAALPADAILRAAGIEHCQQLLLV